MKILIDTNVLISAALFPDSTPHLAFEKAVLPPNKGVICEQNIDEIRRVFNRKFPSKISLLESFFTMSLINIEVIQIPVEADYHEAKIRDASDRPLLRAAIKADVDIILTGDKDFLVSGITSPKIMTCSQFLSKQ